MKQVQPAVLSPLGAMLRRLIRQSEHHTDGIVEGFGQVSVPACESSVVPYFEGMQCKGRARASAVAAHLRTQSRELAETYMQMLSKRMQDQMQAGAAATEAMAAIIEAAMAGDGVTLKGVLELFVNDAIDTGAVAL